LFLDVLEIVKNGFIYTYAMLTSVVFLIFPFVGLAVYAFGNDKKVAVQRATDITMFFLIGAVAVLYDMIFDTSIKGVWIIIFFLLLLTGLLGNLQNRKRGKIDLRKVIRAVWRLGFITLVIFYLLFMLVGIIQSILKM
jgi:hypothetical protein